MSATSTALMTAEELMRLPRGYFRAELINGVLVTIPLPRLPHGRAAMRLGMSLGQFILDHNLGETYITDVGFQLTRNPDTVVGPDISFISKERLEQAGDVTGYWQGPPDLAVEVYSPGYRPGKVSQRISRLFSFGTKQVWIVDLKASTVKVYRSTSDVTTFSGSDYLEAQDILPGFRLSLDKIFGPKPAQIKESTFIQEK